MFRLHTLRIFTTLLLRGFTATCTECVLRSTSDVRVPARTPALRLILYQQGKPRCDKPANAYCYGICEIILGNLYRKSITNKCIPTYTPVV